MTLSNIGQVDTFENTSTSLKYIINYLIFFQIRKAIDLLWNGDLVLDRRSV